MSIPANVPVPSLAPLQPGTAVCVNDDADNYKVKKAYITGKVDPNNPHVNQYDVTFCGFLDTQMFVKETFVDLGGDVLPTHEWKHKNAAARARARQLETAVRAAAKP